jgi:hypothetical protein
MRRLIVFVLPCLLLAACGGGGDKTIKVDGAEQSVVGVVARETHFTPTDVSCPSGVKAQAGGTFDCHFTGPDGNYVAHVRITAVNGNSARFFVRTQRLKPHVQ